MMICFSPINIGWKKNNVEERDKSHKGKKNAYKFKCQMTCRWFDKNGEKNYLSTKRPKKTTKNIIRLTLKRIWFNWHMKHDKIDVMLLPLYWISLL
jgi:hypothetical protein